MNTRQRAALRLAVFALLASSASPSDAQQQLSVEETVRRAGPSVVQVMVFDRATSQPSGLGSGFFVSSDGLVVTNYHVVAGASAASIVLSTGETYSVLGYVAADRRADLAVLRLARTGFPFLSLANSDSIRPGAGVVAIGSPRGFSQTVTTGVASRLQLIDGVYWLQHSAPVSPGNSGGPLLDRLGRVVGVNTWQRTDAQNLNFSVPANILRALLPGDSLRPLSALPPTGIPLATASRPDSGGSPTGITGLYAFSSPVASFSLVFLVELPTGDLTGALFSPHPSGFFDVMPIGAGQRSTRIRDFAFSVRDRITFWGWVRQDGRLGGDVDIEDASGQHTGAPFEASPFYSDPERLPSFAGAKLWAINLTNPTDSLWGLLATVSPRGLGEATVGLLHAWRLHPGVSVPRYTIILDRGGVSDSGGGLWLEKRDSTAFLRLRENQGAVAGIVSLGSAPDSPFYSFRGYRYDLAACLDPRGPAADVALLRSLNQTLHVVEDSVNTLRDRAATSGRDVAAPRNASERERAYFDSTNAAARRERARASQALARLDNELSDTLEQLRRVTARIAQTPRCPAPLSND